MTKDNESRYLELTLYTKLQIRTFYVVVVQRRQRNVQKSVMHVQSSCFGNPNILLFCSFRCRRRRRCFNSLIAVRRVPSNGSRNNCGTHFVSSFLDNLIGVSITAVQSKQRTIPREPAGGTGTIDNCDTNSIKAILNPRASVVSNLGKTL